MSQPAPSVINISGYRIHADDVQLIVAEKGLSLAGGEMVIWKRNIVVTPSRRFVLPGPPDQNAAAFKQLITSCPRAVAIDANGAITLPRLAPGADEDPLDILQKALAAANRELGRQITKTLGFALLFGALGVGLIIFIIAFNTAHPKEPGGFRIGVFGLVMVVAAVLFLIRVFALVGRRSRLTRVLRDLITKGEINAPALAATVAPMPAAPSPATSAASTLSAPPQSPVNLLVATLAILSLVLMLCPYVGLVISIIAFICTFKRRSWARTLAIIGLIVSSLITCLGVILALLHH